MSRALTEHLEQTPHRADATFTTSEALKLRFRGFSFQEIANQFGVNKQTVYQRLRRIIPDADRLPGYEAYKANQADFLDLKAYQTLQLTVTDTKLKQLDAYRGALTTAILTDKARLIRGESTQNLSVRGVVEHYQRDLEAATVALQQLMTSEVIEKTQE